MAELFEKFEVNRDPEMDGAIEARRRFARPASGAFVDGHLRSCVSRHH